MVNVIDKPQAQSALSNLRSELARDAAAPSARSK
jgi:hypothetical protein